MSPKPGDYVRVYRGSGSDSDYSDEAMEEVDLSASKWGSHARYTVYRIADAAKRIMNDTEVPVFEKQVHGAGDWVAITPAEIWYGAGYIVLSAALNSDDLVHCASGHHLTPTEFFGCATRSFADKTKMQECTCYGDTAVARAPTIDDWDGKIEAFHANKCAELTTTGGASNSHIKLIHSPGGVDGDLVSLEIASPSGSDPIDVSVTDEAIVVTPPTGATASQCIAAMNTSSDVADIGIRAMLPAGENGSGAIGAFTHTHLAGGADKVNFTDLKGTRHVFRFYGDYANGDMHVGFGFVSDVDWTGGPEDLLKAGLSIQGHGYPLRHVSE